MPASHLLDKCGGGGGNMQKHKLLLLACLFLTFAFALPVQGQATPVPTATRQPLASPCGLPNLPASWNNSTTQTVWNMTADCVLPDWPGGLAYIRVYESDFTINGNGYTLYTDRANWILAVTGSATRRPILRINNMTIAGVGTSIGVPVRIKRGGTLYANNVTFRNLHPQHPIQPPWDTQQGLSPLFLNEEGSAAYLTNVRFINNDGTALATPRVFGSAITLRGNNAVMEIDGATFRGNRGADQVIAVYGWGDVLRLRGCITFEDNYGYTDTTAKARNIIVAENTGASLEDSSSCPKKKKEEPPRPDPTATPRPQIAATHVALQAETGATFRTAYGLDSGVHFRQLDAAGIGVQSIIDAGYLEAFDVWGYVEQGVEVCFPQVGRVILLDATTIPRSIVPLASTVANGQTCVSINSPGSLVLLPLE